MCGRFLGLVRGMLGEDLGRGMMVSAFDIFNKLKCFKKLNFDINQKFIELEHTCVCLKNVLGSA